MLFMETLTSAKVNLLWTSLASLVISTIVSYIAKKLEVRDKLKAEYSHEQQKKIRELIGSYHGRLVRSSRSLNYRFFNLYRNHKKDWLNVRGKYRSLTGYYFSSFVHRLLCVLAIVRQFEKEAIYLDARIAEKNDFIFLNYLDAFHWVMTDAQLFKGLEYDSTSARDHFFSDFLRALSEKLWVDDDFVSLDLLGEIIKEGQIDSALKFLDGLSKSENRFRWDRLICFHLLLLAFMNRFGYESDKAKQEKFDEIVSMANQRVILENFDSWFGKLGLEKDREIKRIRKAIRKSSTAKLFKIPVFNLSWSN